MARLGVFRAESEEGPDVMRWLDRQLIRLVSDTDAGTRVLARSRWRRAEQCMFAIVWILANEEGKRRRNSFRDCVVFCPFSARSLASSTKMIPLPSDCQSLCLSTLRCVHVTRKLLFFGFFCCVALMTFFSPAVHVPPAEVALPAGVQQQPRRVVLLQAPLRPAGPHPVPHHGPAHPLLVLLPRTTRGQPHTFHLSSGVFDFFFFSPLLVSSAADDFLHLNVFSLFSWTAAASCQIASC